MPFVESSLNCEFDNTAKNCPHAARIKFGKRATERILVYVPWASLIPNWVSGARPDRGNRRGTGDHRKRTPVTLDGHGDVAAKMQVGS